jgi:hypothetical protein
MNRATPRALTAAAMGLVVMLQANAGRAGEIACQSRTVPTASCFRPTRADAVRCSRAPLKPAACFDIRGRLSAWNGAPSLRLQPAGGRRLLGVLGPEGDAVSPVLLPEVVRAAMAPPAPGSLRPVAGVFRVCPLALQKPGHMQPVCIAGVSHLVSAAPPD